ncbi:MAG: hypothetical protein L6R39_003832, partial [Caloplaca ligustica]
MNQKLWAITIEPSGSLDRHIDHVDKHEVFFLMLPNQERYALDLTHAQYGHHDETLMPWATYVETRVTSTLGQYPIGRAMELARKMMVEEFGKEGLLLQLIEEEFGAAMTAAVRDSSGWTKFWKEPDETTYNRRIEQLMQHVTTRLDKLISARANDSKWKLYSSS